MTPTTPSGAAVGEAPRPAGARIVTVHDPIDVPAWCGYCSGTGWFTETVEDATGRGVEVDYTCPVCSGTGQER